MTEKEFCVADILGERKCNCDRCTKKRNSGRSYKSIIKKLKKSGFLK